MNRKLLLCCIIFSSISLLFAQSVRFTSALPNIVICDNKDAHGNDDSLGFYYENAFDLNDYVGVEGIEKNELYWGFEGISQDAGSASPLLLVNGIGDTSGAFSENLTGVGTAGASSQATFSVSGQPLAGGSETYDFMVSTGIDNQADKETCEVMVTYVDVGADTLSPNYKPHPVIFEDWSDLTGWNAVNVYSNFGSYGNGRINGDSQLPSIQDGKLTIEMDNSQYMSYVNENTFDVDAGKTYLIGMPIRVNCTAGGTGAASYPIIRLMCIYETEGVKQSDYLMYVGAKPAMNAFQTYTLAYTAESDSEDFQIRLDVLNGTGTTISVDYDKFWAFPLTDYPMETLVDWSDMTGWESVDVYGAFGAYGNGRFSGSSQEPSVGNSQLHISLDNSQYMSFIYDNRVDVPDAGQYLLKIPVQVNYTAQGTGPAAFPVVRLIGFYEREGTKASDYLMYEGYSMASNSTVDYYLTYTAESGNEDFMFRLDVANGTGNPCSVDFGQIESTKIDPEDLMDISNW